jgi:anti-sigma-K factor RskA
VLPGRAKKTTASTSRWRRIYLAVAIYTVLSVAMLYVFSSYFGV